MKRTPGYDQLLGTTVIFSRGCPYHCAFCAMPRTKGLGSSLRYRAPNLIEEEIAGLKPKGPFKHFWGWDSRLVGKDKPFSLFLASGIPFEVIDEVTKDGWIFLSNEDAISVVEGRVMAKSNNLVVRKDAEVVGDDFIQLEETMDDIFAFKKSIIPKLKNIPYVEGDTPVIFSWYPTAGKALLWNVNEVEQSYKILLNSKVLHEVSIEGLDVALISV